jgi:predicted ArsR family transcriptional regulator
MNLEEEILELLKRKGPVTVYRIAKTFGITYGTA